VAKFQLFHDAALRSARVKWLLHELFDDAFSVRYVDTYGAEQYGAEFLSINPNHAIPVLEIAFENGSTLNMIESAAMISLLADAYPDKKLAPPPGELSPARADYLQMLHFGATMDAMLWQVRLHRHLLPVHERVPRVAERYSHKFFREVVPQLMTRLSQNAYACGDSFSAVDCILTHVVMWARAYGLCEGDVFSHYLARVTERPAFQKAFADRDRFVREIAPDSPVVQMITG
jgi:glutathione S-transferase